MNALIMYTRIKYPMQLPSLDGPIVRLKLQHSDRRTAIKFPISSFILELRMGTVIAILRSSKSLYDFIIPQPQITGLGNFWVWISVIHPKLKLSFI